MGREYYFNGIIAQTAIDDIHQLALPIVVEMRLRLIEQNKCVFRAMQQVKESHAPDKDLLAIA